MLKFNTKLVDPRAHVNKILLDFYTYFWYSTGMPQGSAKAITQAAHSILAPIVRFMLRHGLKLPEIIEILKQTLVQESQKLLAEAGADVNASKVSIMTGVHRAEATRLLQGESKRNDKSAVLTRIIGQWQLAKKFKDKNNKPRPLKFEGVDCEFTALVESVSKEISPYTVFFELERIQAIKRVGDTVELQVQEQSTRGDIEAAMTAVSEDIQSLLEATERNVWGNEPIPQLQLRTYFDNVSLDALEEITQWLLMKGETLHKEVRDFVGSKDLDIAHQPDKSGQGYVSFGTFAVVKKPKPTTAIVPRKRGRKKHHE
jgi:hypothetical protein